MKAFYHRIILFYARVEFSNSSLCIRGERINDRVETHQFSRHPCQHHTELQSCQLLIIMTRLEAHLHRNTRYVIFIFDYTILSSLTIRLCFDNDSFIRVSQTRYYNMRVA